MYYKNNKNKKIKEGDKVKINLKAIEEIDIDEFNTREYEYFSKLAADEIVGEVIDVDTALREIYVYFNTKNVKKTFRNKAFRENIMSVVGNPARLYLTEVLYVLPKRIRIE